MLKNGRKYLEIKIEVMTEIQYNKFVDWKEVNILDIANEIGVNIKKARKDKRLTQKELAEKVDISRNYISDIECGRYTPSVEKLLLISTVLEIDLNIFKNDGNTSIWLRKGNS